MSRVRYISDGHLLPLAVFVFHLAERLSSTNGEAGRNDCLECKADLPKADGASLPVINRRLALGHFDGPRGMVGCPSISLAQALPMPYKHNAARRHDIPKMSFKVQNWPASLSSPYFNAERVG